jgi:regulator of protease activity HflC (stomatin/prohibitin superfamily)
MTKRLELKPDNEVVDQFRIFNGLSFTLFAIAVAVGVGTSYLTGQPFWQWLLLGVGLVILFSVKVVQQWEKAIILRFGKFHRVVSPGLFVVIPVVDSVVAWVDHRVMVSPFSAERTLTKDTVPVDVDAVLFWHVWDARKAALEVKDYQAAISWAAQTALRDIIGKMMLADILVGREMMDRELQAIIDERTTPWGITVNSVEIRDIVIPAPLEDAMSRQAQAERERQARLILGEAEKQVAQSFLDASELYEKKPMAFRLRAMNMLFEGMKERGSLIIVPTESVNTLGAAYSMAATLSSEAVAAASAADLELPKGS